MNKAIKEFLEANTLKRRHIVRCGFELETQHTECNEKTVDDDAVSEAISGEVDAWMNSNVSRRLAEFISQSTMDSIRDEVRDDIEQNFDTSEYERSDNESIQDEIGNHNVEVVDDSSVSGVEIRTIGGLSYLDFVSALRDSFKLEHRIDKACSFHIHLSLPEVQHSYGERFQLALVEYLVESIPRLPDNVQKRFQSATSNQYIRGITSSREKYSFVNAHSLNTWEFRCFGNVKSVSEGIACLNIAIDAMAYAYACVKQGRPLMTDSFDGDIKFLLHGCLERLEPLSQRLRRIRKLTKNGRTA